MQILSSGSFINTDNQEKIEQLIFTAKEIAETAVKTDGFVNGEENNKRLALDIWQGAEYMCRDAEEARIKNIFVSNFLERLREIGGTKKQTIDSPQEIEFATEIELPNKTDASKDEFLGLVATDETQESETTKFESYEIAEEAINAEIELSQEQNDSGIKNDESAKNDEILEMETVAPETGETEISKPSEQNESIEKESGSAKDSLQLPEKEPYKWDKCTVTATIQLLPAETEKRRVVLSVRTHDFPPQISVHEFAGEAKTEQMLPALEQAFEKYQADLPLKVMDKLKKEKKTAKKQSRKTPAKTSEESPKKSTDNRTVTNTEVRTGENASQNVIIPAERSVQGNLFGF